MNYTNTPAYKLIESLNKDQLKVKKHRILEGIRYHKENNRMTRVNELLSQYEHIEKRLK
jgi:hypothetical protein